MILTPEPAATLLITDPFRKVNDVVNVLASNSLFCLLFKHPSTPDLIYAPPPFIKASKLLALIKIT